MSDEITCEAPLPGHSGSVAGESFQTKSFPDCGGMHYTIREDGRIVDSSGQDLELDGYIELYSVGHHYRAHFRNGDLQGIIAVTEDERGIHYGIARYKYSKAPSQLFTQSSDEASVRKAALELMDGDQDAAEAWLTKPRPILNDKSALEYVSEGKAAEVINLIAPIQQGIFS